MEIYVAKRKQLRQVSAYFLLLRFTMAYAARKYAQRLNSSISGTILFLHLISFEFWYLPATSAACCLAQLAVRQAALAVALPEKLCGVSRELSRSWEDDFRIAPHVGAPLPVLVREKLQCLRYRAGNKALTAAGCGVIKFH